MDDEKIVLTKAELHRIIKDAVKENMQEKPNSLNFKNLFNDLSRDLETEIIELNTKYGIGPFSQRGCSDAIYPVLFARYSEFPPLIRYGSGRPQLPVDVHEGIRKTVLSILGVSRNSDIKKRDYQLARNTYQELASVIVDAYQDRLEDAFDATKN